MKRQLSRLGLSLIVILVMMAQAAIAADPAPADAAAPAEAVPAGPRMMSLGQLFEAGGTIGYIITGLSVLAVALVVEHLFSLRSNALIQIGRASCRERV